MRKKKNTPNDVVKSERPTPLKKESAAVPQACSSQGTSLHSPADNAEKEALKILKRSRARHRQKKDVQSL
jgi:hypothetical protein